MCLSFQAASGFCLPCSEKPQKCLGPYPVSVPVWLCASPKEAPLTPSTSALPIGAGLSRLPANLSSTASCVSSQTAITTCRLRGFVQDFLKPIRLLHTGQCCCTLRRLKSNRQAWGLEPRFTLPHAPACKVWCGVHGELVEVTGVEPVSRLQPILKLLTR